MGSGGGDGGASLYLQQKQMEESKKQAEASRASAILAQEVVTPAVARSIAQDTTQAQGAQEDARARLRGIRGTYNRFSSADGAVDNGSKKKLG